MTVLTAETAESCVACGSTAEWNPARTARVCPSCGTEAPLEIDSETGQVAEIDLVRTLREMPEEQRGWNAHKHSVRCSRCSAVSIFDSGKVGQNCNFCGAPELIDYEELKSPIRPESVVPFKVAETSARERLRRWCKGRWFAPSDLARRVRIDDVRGVYLPYWTFDAQVFCTWTADSGTYAYTRETVEGEDGVPTTRRQRKVRWRSVRGIIEHRFDDEPVPGTHGVDRGLLRQVEPFPRAGLVPYDSAYLSGFVIEHYQVVLIDAARQARRKMDDQLQMLCTREVPGDTMRELEIDPQYAGQTFKLMLVPVWLLSYEYAGRPYQVVCNGATGKVSGRHPRSAGKLVALAGVVATALATAALLLL